MSKINSMGTCLLCKQSINHRAITRHVDSCLKKYTQNESTENMKEKVFLIKIYAGSEFWLFIEINGSSTLETIDYFLRKTWLECCHHMSQFKINGGFYSSDEKMNKVIHRILPVGTEFDYEYDFGSTTDLQCKIISSRAGELNNELQLIARNDLPIIQCGKCEKLAEMICTSCDNFLCKKCKTHKGCGGVEYMLPVVNSPRMGICGYTGEY